MVNNVLDNLTHITRWSGFPIIKPESVSDHVWGMLALALFHVPTINDERAENGLPSIDLKELVYKIVLHDIDESVYCDIPRPFKHYDDKINSEIERVAQTLMYSNLSSDLVKDALAAKDQSIEGLYTTIFDFIQAGKKMVFEVKLGNRFILNEIPNVIECLEDMVELLEGDSYKTEREFIQDYINGFYNFYNDEQKNSNS